MSDEKGMKLFSAIAYNFSYATESRLAANLADRLLCQNAKSSTKHGIKPSSSNTGLTDDHDSGFGNLFSLLRPADTDVDAL